MSFINVYTGPMKSGKTSRVLLEVNKLKFTNQRILAFKPQLDIRFDKDYIQDRTEQKIKAINIEYLNELSQYADYTDIFVIDEFQFLKGNISTLLELKDSGKSFLISGLNLTAERQPFGLMNDLLCIADNITLMTSVCEICYKDAIYSFCDQPKLGEVLLGDNIYKAVCSDCYNMLKTKIQDN